MFDYDVVFIGSGHACWHAAVALVQGGKKVAIVEQDLVAGTCTNYGCDAKILLDAPFEAIDDIERYSKIGASNIPAMDWKKLMKYKKGEIGKFPLGMSLMFKMSKIKLIKGHGELEDKHTIRIGNKTITSNYIVIGTGEHPNRLDIEGKEYLHDSREFLDLEEFPKRIVFIGAGIISMEFASIALKMKSEVNIIQFNDRALGQYPKKYVDRLVKKMKEEGANFKFNESAVKVEKEQNEYVVTLKSGKKIKCDYVLDAIGRLPNVENMGLDKVGIEYSSKGIKVDEYLRTNIDNIFASGDVIDKRIPKLTPTATFESEYIASYILGLNTEKINYPVIPNLVFTLPRISQVGISVKEAEENKDRYRIVEIPFGKNMLFWAKNDKDIDFTFIFDNNTNDLVGAAFYGSDAGTYVDLVTIIINKKMTQKDLREMIFAFPTETDALLETLKPLLKM